MARGLFTQGVCLLTDGQAAIEDVKAALQEHGFQIVREAPPADNWAFGGPTLVVAFLPQINGYVAVDVVNQSWPDHMGDPKSDPMTFGAWSMGHFGPFVFPGGLARASQHAWAWESARTVSAGHRGFIRIRTSYAFGAKSDAPILPKDYDPLAEMNFIMRMVVAIFNTRSVICYFNPNGEVLRDRTSFRALWGECNKQNKLPLPLWMNIRFFRLGENLLLMDTVGNEQLQIKDVEAVFSSGACQPAHVDYYLRNVTEYLRDFKGELRTGDSIDGPVESDLSWRMEVLENGLIEPPRRVLRLYPKADSTAIQRALADLDRGKHEPGKDRSPEISGKPGVN
jgi:hypothetical protein